MGIRFHRSTRIAKGFRINFSKRGIGFSSGLKGAKISTGSRGTYLNTGIPGTGLYYRKKIDENSSSNSTYSHSNSYPSQNSSYRIQLSIDSETGEIIIKSEDGYIITDTKWLREIKRSEVYKTSVKTLYEKLKNSIEEATTTFTKIHKLTPELFPDIYWQNQIKKMKENPFKKSSFMIPKPSSETIKYEVEHLAEEASKKIFFWKRKKFVQEFIEKKSKELLEVRIEEWEQKKKEFNSKEEKLLEEHNYQISHLNKVFEGDEEEIYFSINSFLSSITLPFEFSANYQLENELLKVDLNLPEIEDIERKKATITQSGRLSIKNKSQKELKEDYAHGVCGLAFFFAGNFFNISPKIREVLVSGCTERISPKTGKTNTEYLYSIIFDRDTFRTLEIENIDPIVAFDNFKHRIRILKTFELKAIEPF